MGFFQKLLGGSNEAKLKDIYKIADRIEALEQDMQALSDAGLRSKTDEFRKRLADGETLDDILPEAFAVVREAAVRTVGMRHYRVQLVGGIVLHQGRISEMKTGEGKTLVATLPSYLNALEGKGVHIVTVNDYLAKRDSEWMGSIHRFLGLKVGLIVHDMDNDERRESYAADITYGTNNELGFDYLRDNMVIYKEEMVQRDHNYAIVDEVDSILIDEARTPLIISGQGDKSTEMYTRADNFVRKLRDEEDYKVDKKDRSCILTEEGVVKAEQFFGVENLGNIENTELNHHINQALKAKTLMIRDVDYVVQDGQVIIVDEFTGRLMTGRRYSDGLHQAIEAKEKVKVEHESKTLATITFQNYFRMYPKLSGMTGTAKTEEEEFQGIYGLDVVEIPTNMAMVREDYNDVVMVSEEAKFNKVVEEVAERHKSGQPILIGTVSVEKSEILSGMLKRIGVKHEVLNAKFHRKEAEIVAQAGQYGTVTIATNMAGRGTDILLGGNPDFMARREMRQQEFEDELINEATSHALTDDADIKKAREVYQQLLEKYKKECDEEHDKVVSVGGLHIIGTERHESRRIDNQLRGRAGRQGDPGSSRFYIALEDDLMKLFGSERIKGFLDRLSGDEEVPIEYGMLSKQIESAQRKVEGRNFQIRKHVLQYDDVMNKQREIIYGQRKKVLLGEDMRGNIMEMLDNYLEDMVQIYFTSDEYDDTWDYKGFNDFCSRLFLKKNKQLVREEELSELFKDMILEEAKKAAHEAYDTKEAEINQAGLDMREIERIILLRTVDRMWTDHIDAMDQFRQGISLRAYAQRDPVIEYSMEGFEMFEEMNRNIRDETLTILFHLQAEDKVQRKRVAENVEATTSEMQEKREASKTPAKSDKKVGRNEPCPCGSGKKYKNCHGA